MSIRIFFLQVIDFFNVIYQKIENQKLNKMSYLKYCISSFKLDFLVQHEYKLAQFMSLWHGIFNSISAAIFRKQMGPLWICDMLYSFWFSIKWKKNIRKKMVCSQRNGAHISLFSSDFSWSFNRKPWFSAVFSVMMQFYCKISVIFGISMKNYIELTTFYKTFFPLKNSPLVPLTCMLSTFCPEGDQRWFFQ